MTLLVEDTDAFLCRFDGFEVSLAVLLGLTLGVVLFDIYLFKRGYGLID